MPQRYLRALRSLTAVAAASARPAPSFAPAVARTTARSLSTASPLLRTSPLSLTRAHPPNCVCPAHAPVTQQRALTTVAPPTGAGAILHPADCGCPAHSAQVATGVTSIATGARAVHSSAAAAARGPTEQDVALDHKDPDFSQLLERNRKWQQSKLAQDPSYFERLAKGQQPEYLFIGCADSRVPAEVLLDAQPGQIFVSRNVANMVVGTDMSMLSVLQFGVEVLKVKHIIVCGHTQCGGIWNAMQAKDAGLIENWLRNIRDVARLHDAELQNIKDEKERFRRLVELNVAEQVLNVYKTGIVQRARSVVGADGISRFPTVHGMVFDIGTGLLKEINVNTSAYRKKFQHIYTLY